MTKLLSYKNHFSPVETMLLTALFVTMAKSKNENITCTWQWPFHKVNLRFVFLIKNFPNNLSGANKIGLFLGMLLIIFSALEDVHIISDIAFTSAEQLIYDTKVWWGCCCTHALKSCEAALSANEHPASMSGIITVFDGFNILAVSLIKCTQQNKITSALVVWAYWANARLSPIKSATS